MKVKRVATSWVAWLGALGAIAAVLPGLLETEYPDATWIGAVRVGCTVAVLLVTKLAYDKSTPVASPHGTISDVPLIPQPDGQNYFASTADFMKHLESFDSETTTTPLEPHDTE
jgi:hypothetical protein